MFRLGWQYYTQIIIFSLLAFFLSVGLLYLSEFNLYFYVLLGAAAFIRVVVKLFLPRFNRHFRNAVAVLFLPSFWIIPALVNFSFTTIDFLLFGYIGIGALLVFEVVDTSIGRIKKFGLVLLLLALVGVTGYFYDGYHAETVRRGELDKVRTQVVNLVTPTDQKLVVYETDKVKLEFGYQEFESYVNNKAEKYPDEDYYLRLKDYLQKEATKSDTINISSTEYMMEDFLMLRSDGHFKLFNKQTNSYESSFKIQDIDHYSGLLGDTHRYILNDGTIFFDLLGSRPLY
jgi:hypothetical protein